MHDNLSPFFIYENTGTLSWSVHVSVTKMEVGRDVVGGLGSKSKKRELIVRDA